MRSPKLTESRHLFTQFMRQLGYADASHLLIQQTIVNKMSRLILRTPRLVASQLRKMVVKPIRRRFCWNAWRQQYGDTTTRALCKPC